MDRMNWNGEKFTPAELSAALKWTKAMLATGQIVHDGELQREKMPLGKFFNLGMTFSNGKSGGSECGTMACIGGWMALRLGLTEPDAVNDFVMNAPRPLAGLFLALSLRTEDWSHVTNEMAVVAITRFEKGLDPWGNFYSGQDAPKTTGENDERK